MSNLRFKTMYNDETDIKGPVLDRLKDSLRGSGTSFVSRLHPVPRKLLFAVPLFSLDHAADVLRFARDYMAEAPDELMALAALWTAPDLPDVPAKYRGSHALFLPKGNIRS